MSPEEDLAGRAPAQEETISKSPASSTPPPMSLNDLAESTPAQEEAIRRVWAHPAKPIRALEPIDPDWGSFRECLWGKGLGSSQRRERVVRDNTVKDVHVLPNPPPLFRFVVPFPKALPEVWGLYSRRILVRSEYYETEQAALLDNRKGGLLRSKPRKTEGITKGTRVVYVESTPRT